MNSNAGKMIQYTSFIILGFVFLLVAIALELPATAISNAQLPIIQPENTNYNDKISAVERTSNSTLYNLAEDIEDYLKNASIILEFASILPDMVDKSLEVNATQISSGSINFVGNALVFHKTSGEPFTVTYTIDAKVKDISKGN